MNHVRPRAKRAQKASRAIVATVILLAPSLALLSAAPVASALDTVPFADGIVPWQQVAGIRNLLYFKDSGDAGVTMDTIPNNAPDVAGSPDADASTLQFGTIASVAGTDVAIIRGPRLTHEVNVSGNNALTVRFFALSPSDPTGEADLAPTYTWTVTLRSEGPDERVGSFSWESDTRSDPCTAAEPFMECIVPVQIDNLARRYTFKENSRLRIDISAAASGGQLPIGTATNAWGLRVDDSARPSMLEMRAENAVKVATWTTDKDSIATKVFRPLYRPGTYNRVDAFFAIKSAFGALDVCRVPPANNFPENCNIGDEEQNLTAESQIYYRANHTSYPIGPLNLTHVDMNLDDNSTEGEGIIVWRLPRNLWDIGRFPFPNGEFTLEASHLFRADDPTQSWGLLAKWDFVISTQQLTLRPYDDNDPATLPTPLESQAHEIASGGSTTFLILAANGGRIHDNLTIDVQLVSAQPAFGWIARVRSDKLSGPNVLAVPPLGEELFLLTITAPAGALPGQSAVFSVTTRSNVDTHAKSKPYTVIATVSDIVREDVGIVIREPVQRVRPGLDNDFQAYVWNRGTRPANLTMTLREVATEGWNSSLVGSADRYRFTAATIAPGDLFPVQVRIRPDPALSVGTDHNVTLNVTRAAGGGPGAEAQMFFRLSSFTSFRVEVLRGINDDRHWLEMKCDLGPSPTAPQYCSNAANFDDSVNGTYYRAWITNTGDVSSRYAWFIDDWVNTTANLASPSLGPVPPVSAPDETGEATGDNRLPAFADPQIGFRDPKGRFSAVSGIDLAPGQTAEVYVWVPHTADAGDGQESTTQFEFVVRNTGTQQELRRIVRATGIDSNNNGSPGTGADFAGDGLRRPVKLEPVERTREYFTSGGSKPIVDITQATKSSVTKFVDLSGVPQLFFARLTHGYSFRDHYTDPENPSEDNFVPSDVTAVLKGVTAARELGWNVSMRPRIAEPDERKNPWKERLVLTNQNDQNAGRWESFRDYEIEIQVRPPINGSAKVAAGETRTFTLEAGGAVLEFTAVVSQLANVTLNASKQNEVVHAGQQAAFALLLSNQGSIRAPISLKARVEGDQNANLWTISPNEQNLDLTAHENRTLALLVGAPPTAVAGDTVTVNVSAEFAKIPNDPNSQKVTRYLELHLQVRPPSKLRLTPQPNSVQSAPGGLANFTLEVKSLDNSRRTPFMVEVSPLPNWTQSYPAGGRVEAGATERFAYLLQVPTDVLRDRSYASVVKVTDTQDPDNFDVAVVQVNIIGGQPFPIVSPAKAEALVNRDGTTRFLMGVKNLGNAAGTFPLEAKAGDSRWGAHVENAAGQIIRDVTVLPNENVNVFLVVRAPRSVLEGTALPVTLTAFSPNFDRNSAATVRALIHDYGVDVEVRPARADVIAGQSVDFTVKVTNLGNGNDTLNLSADLQGLGDWTASFSTEQVTLNPGTSTDVALTIRSPRERLPVARSYTMSVFAGSVGGSGLGLPKNDSSPIVLSVLNYRAFDVDSDGFLELAVDRNKRTTDGFEHFLEIFSQGQVTQVVDNLSGKEDGRLDFLLDVPEDGSYDGVADLYYDPQEPFVYVIEFTPDINGDATPDYLLDTDNDGVIDHAWDTATRTLWAVTVIRAFGGTAEQYLVDMNGDGKPDRYFDPAKNLVTRTVPQDDGRVGILTGTGDRSPSKFYDVNSGEVSDARVSSLGDFARTYWYFFLAFVAVLVVFAAVLVKRRK